MFLSRLMLRLRSHEVRRDLDNSYEMHRTLARAWGDDFKAARVLFRVDEASNGILSLLVQSQSAPDWAKLPPDYATDVQFQKWAPRFHEGQSLRFRLQANPVFAFKVNGARDGVRSGLFREAERLDWLRRQGETHGFEMPMQSVLLHPNATKQKLIFRGKEFDELSLQLPAVQVVDLNAGRQFSIPSCGEQFSAARFDGTLCVTDAEKFRHAIENGIGKARGFGFGLLSVARV